MCFKRVSFMLCKAILERRKGGREGRGEGEREKEKEGKKRKEERKFFMPPRTRKDGLRWEAGRRPEAGWSHSWVPAGVLYAKSP